MLSLFLNVLMLILLCSQAALHLCESQHCFTYYSTHFSFLICLHSMVPTYMLSTQENMTFKKKKNEEQERLKSSGNLVLWTDLNSFIMINQSIGCILLYSSAGNKLHYGVPGVWQVFTWVVSASPTTLESGYHYPHFIVTLRRS